MRSRANDAAILAGLFWCVGGIELNAPQLDRVFLLVAGAVLFGLSLAGRDQGPFICWYAFLIGASERFSISFSRLDLLTGRERVPSFFAFEVWRAAGGREMEVREFEERARVATFAQSNSLRCRAPLHRSSNRTPGAALVF